MISMGDLIPSKKEIVGIVEAQTKSIDSISERLVKIERLVDKQDTRNRDIIYAVLIAFLLIVVSVAIEVLLSNRVDKKFYSDIEKNTYEQNLKVQELDNKIENIRARNSYLK